MDKEKALQAAPIESKLVPVLREGVDIVKMILFKELRSALAEKYPDRDAQFIGRLSGGILNDLFGVENLAEPFAGFKRRHQDLIDAELASLAESFADLRIALTDALRVQFLCDSREGIDSESVLVRANELGILLVDRDIPLPKFFMNLVRRLGVAHQILDPEAVMAIPEDDGDPVRN